MALMTALAIGGQLIGGLGSFLSSRANARRDEEQAQEERRAAAAEIRRTKDEVRAAIGEQLAAQVSNGLDGGSGTALDALRQSQIEGALDVMELRRQGELRSRALRQRASDSRREGRFALLEGVLGAGSSFLKQRSDWAQERRFDSGGGLG